MSDNMSIKNHCEHGQDMGDQCPNQATRTLTYTTDEGLYMNLDLCDQCFVREVSTVILDGMVDRAHWVRIKP